jgi:hypothetical protein
MYNAYKVSKNEGRIIQAKKAVSIIYIEFQFKQEVLAQKFESHTCMEVWYVYVFILVFVLSCV